MIPSRVTLILVAVGIVAIAALIVLGLLLRRPTTQPQPTPDPKSPSLAIPQATPAEPATPVVTDPKSPSLPDPEPVAQPTAPVVDHVQDFHDHLQRVQDDLAKAEEIGRQSLARTQALLDSTAPMHAEVEKHIEEQHQITQDLLVHIAQIREDSLRKQQEILGSLNQEGE